VSLTVSSLNAFYGPFQALHGVSFSVGPGTIHALLGRNGAGKTTTLRAIFGLVRRTGAPVEAGGIPLDALKPHVIAKLGIAYIPEYRGAFSSLSVLENLQLCEPHRGSIALERVLELFPHLKSLLRRSGAHLSGGEQQMLVIARALMSSPKFLLLDEPSQGLAPLIVDAVVGALETLKRDNIGILLVEQNAELALDIAGEATVLDNGHIAFNGHPKHLKENDELLRICLGVDTTHSAVPGAGSRRLRLE
jgi:branched-chain amino acid transport system ATP-binding protein